MGSTLHHNMLIMKMLSLVLAFLLVTEFATAQTVDDCPITLTRDEYLQVYGDSCYQFVLYRKRNHDDAQSDCRADGGTLVLVQSEEIQNYIYDQIINVYNYSVYYDKVWIGLDDLAEKDTFVWEDGTSLGYSNWAAYQNIVSNDCVVMDLGIRGQWREYQCAYVYFLEANALLPQNYPYVCQYKINVSVSQ